MRANIKTSDYFDNYYELQLDDLNYYESSLEKGKAKEGRISAVKRKLFTISFYTLITKYSSGYEVSKLILVIRYIGKNNRKSITIT